MIINDIELLPNFRVIIRLKKKNDFEIYQSRIDDVTEEYISLAIPTRGGEIVPLHVGEKLEVSFTKDDALYAFKGPIMRRESKPIPLLFLAVPKKIIRLQRRQFVRVETFLPIWLHRVTPEEKVAIHQGLGNTGPNRGIEVLHRKKKKSDTAKEKEAPSTQGVVHNISAGGLLVAAPKQFEVREFLRLRFSLEQIEEKIEVYGRVVRCYELSSEDTSYPNSMGIEFLPVSPDIRHKIIQYTFNRQIELKKRGIQ